MKMPPRPIASTEGNAEPANPDELATVLPVKIAGGLAAAEDSGATAAVEPAGTVTGEDTVGFATAGAPGATGVTGRTGATGAEVGASPTGGAETAGEDAGGGALRLASTSPSNGGTVPC
jgi:hypothetical protein